MKVDLEQIAALVAEGLLSTRPHQSGKLLIHNYTPQCQFARAWNPITLMCRGLVTDLDGNVIARPFPKFFNHDEHERFIGPLDWSQGFAATKKMDGSLGVLYPSGCEWAIATRGSFDSGQAKTATAIFRERGYGKAEYREGHTYLFEIIYPENRIVVDYGELRDLVLLEVLDTETGKGLPLDEIRYEAELIGCPVADPVEASAESLLAREGAPTNEEGYVVRFADGTRVKIKFAEYVRLHKLLTGLNARLIWEHLRNGFDWKQLVEHVPDEFHDWVREIVADIEGKFLAEMQRMQSVYCQCDVKLSRKEVAEQFKKTPDLAPALFAYYDGKAVDHIIWKNLRPEPSAPFANAEI